MSNYNWSKFIKRVNIKAANEKIYHAIATSDGLESWFLRKAEFTTPNSLLRTTGEHIFKGDTYKWLWHGYGDEMIEAGKILEANGKDLVQFTFEKTCIVTISIKTEQDETVLELSQDNIPVDEKSKSSLHLGCSTGWVFYLANLKSILEGGVDLRNKNEQLKNMINA